MEGQQIPAEFTYSVTWRETTVPFEKRMDKYRRYQFLPQHLEVRAACSLTPLVHVPPLLRGRLVSRCKTQLQKPSCQQCNSSHRFSAVLWLSRPVPGDGDFSLKGVEA